MKRSKILVIKLFAIFMFMQTVVFAQGAKEIFINANTGNDQNTGTKESPLKSLSEAAKKINNLQGKGAITIYLSKGVYGMAETAKFTVEKWQFSESDRLTIRAENYRTIPIGIQVICLLWYQQCHSILKKRMTRKS